MTFDDILNRGIDIYENRELAKIAADKEPAGRPADPNNGASFKTGSPSGALVTGVDNKTLAIGAAVLVGIVTLILVVR